MSYDHYSNNLYTKFYDGAIKKLKKISPERVMTERELEKIFGNFEYAECHDAFNDIRKERLLLKVAPGLYRTASHAEEKITQICADDIKSIITDTEKLAEKIRKLVLKRADELKGLPFMNFGIREDKKQKDDKFWTEANVVVLTPEGIYECPYIMITAHHPE